MSEEREPIEPEEPDDEEEDDEEPAPEAADATVDQLREVLAKQILELAIADSNPQLKIDVYKATTTRASKPPATVSVPAATSMMSFQRRVAAATEQGNTNGADKPPSSDTRD